MAVRDETLVFFAEQPRVQTAKTEARGQGWVTSGTVAFPIRQGRNTYATLEFPYENAGSETEAIRQAAPQLQAVAKALTDLATQIAGR